MHVIFNCLIHQEYQNEHTSQGAEVMFGERYVYAGRYKTRAWKRAYYRAIYV